VSQTKLVGDYHTHTRASHGLGSVEANVRAALERGLRQVAITDHGPANPLFGSRGVRGLVRLQREVRRVNALYPSIDVLAGVEANITGLEGTLDVPEDVLSGLDVVIAALHFWTRPATLADARRLFAPNAPWAGGRRRREHAVAGNTRAVVRAIERNRIDIIAHPGLGMPVDPVEVARACARHNVLMEINAMHAWPRVAQLRLAVEEGVDFVINSDAHRPGAVGRLEKGLALARAAGVPPERIANAAGSEAGSWRRRA